MPQTDTSTDARPAEGTRAAHKCTKRGLPVDLELLVLQSPIAWNQDADISDPLDNRRRQVAGLRIHSRVYMAEPQSSHISGVGKN
jgi:hypothetical protein